MNDRRKRNVDALIGLAMICGLAIGLVGLCLWTDRSLDFWATWVKGRPVDVPWWLSILSTFFLNAFAVAFNVLTEIARWVKGP